MFQPYNFALAEGALASPSTRLHWALALLFWQRGARAAAALAFLPFFAAIGPAAALAAVGGITWWRSMVNVKPRHWAIATVLVSAAVCIGRDIDDHTSTDRRYAAIERAVKTLDAGQMGRSIPLITNTSYAWMLLDMRPDRPIARLPSFNLDSLRTRTEGTVILFAADAPAEDVSIPGEGSPAFIVRIFR